MTEKKMSRSELKRKAIVNAAKTAFLTDGVQATSMDKLAELAQVSKRTVYNHFATKQDLVMFLLTDKWTETLVKVDAVYNPLASLEEQLTPLILQEIELMIDKDYIELARMALGYYFYHPEELKKHVDQITAQETIIDRWLKSAIDSGKVIVDDIEFATEQLHKLIKGNCFWPVLLQVESPPSTSQKQMIASETAKMFLARYAV
ncbi:TetR/AcrR family transcriptional regulator [Aliiglaciecola sp. LCG003]|uniref:TetR/AcrR family transcriptional regulator n=1 Tax=Aliiglaciecola sp. LCG003 TaxID=3053655 RepID=UPI00257307A9|nr:TetR/AcrR family transcriptional regulator [Aliiglaciecola sp. LCG003]WJG09196.1 TetR/AcrR family transcriptional regulator [Aliiglaciecola sp. LCG003]